jgi:hypothetical protein
LITADEVAKILGISRGAVYDLSKEMAESDFSTAQVVQPKLRATPRPPKAQRQVDISKIDIISARHTSLSPF